MKILITFILLISFNCTYSKCDLNCSICITDLSIIDNEACDKCNDGYGLLRGLCSKVSTRGCRVDNCITCFLLADNICHECKENYIKNLAGKCYSTTKCFDENCLECKNNNESGCLKCADDFTLTEEGTCSSNCINNNMFFYHWRSYNNYNNSIRIEEPFEQR